MRIGKALLVLWTILILTACGKQPSTTAKPQPTTSPKPSFAEMEVAWDFTLNDLDGNAVTLSNLQGKWVFLNFWATWCKPCVKEMPALQEISETYADQIVVLGIDVREDPEVIKPFLERYGITYMILLTPNGR